MSGLEKEEAMEGGPTDPRFKGAGDLERAGHGSVRGARGEEGAGLVINASGHKQEVERIFSIWSIVGFATTTGNTWLALGGSLTVAINNGGSPGVIYEFIAVSVFYWFIAASIAELASAVPSAGGVYHWASVTAGRYGRVCGYFAGWWNFFAWIFGLAAIAQIVGAQTVSMYALTHPDFVIDRWHVFVAYLVASWVCCFACLFANKALPAVEQAGGFLIVAGVLITIIVCAVMPSVNGQPYASTDFVWKTWANSTGYSMDGFVFCLGMLTGAFAVGTPDVVTHMAEEIPNPSINIPKAILAQYIVGFFSSFFYLIALFYGITDLDGVLESRFLFPLAEIYRQCTGSAGGSLGLLILVFLPTFVSLIGCYLTASRTFWTLSRDNATPFAPFFAKISPKYKNPFNSIAACGCISTVLGCIYVGSSTAFSAFVGSFVILSSVSYVTAILPHLLSKRKNVSHGWFWMRGPIGYVVNAISSLYILVFIVIYCFPFFLPVDAESMNYSCLITGGLSVFIGLFWLWRQKDYVGPKVVMFDPLAAEVAAVEAETPKTY